MIIAPWTQKTIKTPWQHGFFTSLSLSYQLRQHKQLTLLQMLQSNVEAYGGVRKLLSYQLCWPLSQPKVKNEIHPKHIFSNAVVMLPQWHSPVVSAFPSPSPAQSPLLPPPSDTKFAFQQQCHSAWEKWDLIPTGARGGATTTDINTTQALRDQRWVTLVGKKPPRPPGMPWVASHGKKYWGYSAGFWLKLSRLHPLWTSLCEGCGHRRAFGDPQGGMCPWQTQSV